MLMLLTPSTTLAQSAADRPLTASEAQNEFERMARTGGYWATSNADYAVPGGGEPEEYRMAFAMTPDGFGMRGCMWGASEATPTPPFWHFFHAWDPSREAVLAYQASPSGSVAVGWEHRARDGGRESVQTLHAPDGAALEVRHLNRPLTADSILSRSFQRSSTSSGEWEPRRSYTWVWRTTTEPVPC